jgi:hypothetical protein
MNKRRFALASAMGLFLCLSQIAQAVSLDGSIDEPGDEYLFEFSDPTAPSDGDMADDLDVDGVYLDADASYAYFGLSALAPLDTDGDESLFGDGETHVVVGLDNGGGSFYVLRIEFAGGAVPTLITLSDSGAPAVDISGLTTIVVGDDLEARFDNSLFDDLGPDFTFVGRLDGTGFDNDDVFSGTVEGLPEPASLALMGLGSFMMIHRKRR